MADLGNTISLDASRFAAGVAQTRAKLTELNTAFVENRNKMKELNAEARELERQERALRNEMRDGGTREQQEQMQQLRDRIAQVNTQIGQLRTQEQELRQDINRTSRELQEQRQSAGNLADAFGSLAQVFAGLGIAEALNQISNAFKDCVKNAEDFNATMSTVEALSGATADQMSELSDKAKELGATTKFTATESAQAMTYMGMAGWNAEQMLSGMDGVLSLAAASGTDLALTSDIVTDSLTAFGLKAEDTAHFADVLAAAATNSNTSVEIMGETFKNSASVAGALGYSIEDVSTAVGLMANAGVKGTIAGTSLKNTFNGLINGVTLTSQAFGEVEISAVNADGTMKKFGETVNELRGYFSQMSQAERMTNAIDIAGKYGYNGLLAIVNSAQEDFDRLTESINDCEGAAAKMAEVRMDNLQGQVTLMNSAVDALKTTIGDPFQDELRKLAEITTEALTGVNDFLQKNPELTKGIVAVTAAVAGLVGAIGTLSAASAAVKTLNELGIASNIAAVGTKVLSGTLTAIPWAAAIAGAIGLAKAIGDTLYLAVGRASTEVRQVQKEIEELGKSAEDAVAANEAEAQTLRLKAEEYEKLRTTQNRSEYQEKRLKEFADELQTTFGDEVNVVNKLTGEYNDLTQSVEAYIQKQAQMVRQSALEDALKEAYRQEYEINRKIEEEEERHKKAVEAIRNNTVRVGMGVSQESNESLLQAELIQYENNRNGYLKALTELQGKIESFNSDLKESAESLSDNSGAVSESAEAAVNAASDINELRDSYKRLSEQTEETTDKCNTIKSAIDKLNSGTALSYSEVKKLLEISPELVSQIEARADGYHIEVTALEALNESLSSQAKTEIEAQRERTRAALDGARDRIAIYKREAETYAQSTNPEAQQKLRETMAAISEAEKQYAELQARFTGYETSLLGLTGATLYKPVEEKKEKSSPEEKSVTPDDLRAIESGAKSVSEAFREQAENGELALSTVQKLISAGYSEALVFDEATGKATINSEKYVGAVRAQIEVRKEYLEGKKAEKDATDKSIAECNAEIAALDGVSNILGEVTDGTYGLTAAKKTEEKAVKETVKSYADVEKGLKSVSEAFKEQKENGSISFETMNKLVEEGYGGLVRYDKATGEITISEEKLRKAIYDNMSARLRELEAQKQAAKAAGESTDAIDAEIGALRDLRDASKDAAAGLYGLEDADIELKETLTLSSAESLMKSMSDIFKKQLTGQKLDASDIVSVSDLGLGDILKIDEDGITADAEKYKETFKIKLTEARTELEHQFRTAVNSKNKDFGLIGSLKAQISQLDIMLEKIDEVTKGLYGVDKTVISLDEYKEKEYEQQMKKRLQLIDDELAAKKKLRDETLDAINAEVEARKRLTEDNDIQKQIDSVTAQLKYSQLDEFSRKQLEHKLSSLHREQANLAWERGIEDRKARINADYEASEAELKQSKQLINDSANTVKELMGTLANGMTNITNAVNNAITNNNTTNNNTANVSFNNTPNLTAEQIIRVIEDYYGVVR